MTQTDRRTVLQAAAGLVTAAAFTAACTTTGAAAHPTAPKPPTARTPRRIPGHPTHLTHGPGTAPRVALTFHGNGDPATAEAVLEESERHGAHITVLAVGTWLDANPGLARRILDAGHDLGNHTQHHLDINAMQEARARAEITDCAERLRRLTGSIGTWFRPSRAARASPLVARLARDAGYPQVLSYDVDSLDFTGPGPAAISQTLTTEIRPGSIVSLHFGYEDTVAALPAVLEDLARRGLTAVTTTELFS
ncbi:polysaccharide deacetylase family protein [Streptomyces sp. NBC_00287]|uniref:polysaccharide deacetylase family protein n=1 Tax=Streptomyces sp. NBC_00287 TaxID=2975702 RepID=UPI003FA70824